jgi:integrase
MPKLVLNDRLIATRKAEGAPLDLFDAKTKGLNLRVAPSGLKTWFLVYTAPNTGKRARVKLGTYPATGLAKARTLALEARTKIEEGTDPRDLEPEDDVDTGPATVATLAATYLAKKRIKSKRELERRLRVDVLPIIGNVPLSELHRRDAHRVFDPILERNSPSSAKKAHADLRAMIRWAVERGDLDHNPIDGLKVPSKSAPRERFLSEDEIAMLWKAWPKALPAPVALALKLALTTGQRIGEITGMSMEELDLAKAVWNLPASRTKNAHPHSVALSGLALDLIAEARALGHGINGRLFRLSTKTVANEISVARQRGVLPIKDWSAHDLRRTFCTHLAILGVSPVTIGACVNHRGTTKQGVTLSTYVRYDFGREKREAMELWGERLAAIACGKVSAEITPIRA